MQAFWAKGYEATSLSDLMSATGLHKGSIYQAFGDKHSLFKQALKRYLQEIRQQIRDRLASAPTPLDGMRACAHGMLDDVAAQGTCPRGCLAVNSLVELAPHDPEVKEILDQHMELDRQLLEEVVRQAQAQGQLSAKRPPEVVTAMMMTFMAGLATTIKGIVTDEQAHELLDAQFDALR